MSNIPAEIVQGLLDFYNSFAFSVIKFIIGIYVSVIFVDIILLLIQRGLHGDISATRLGTLIPREFVRKGPKNKLARRWGKIKGRLNTGQENEYKLAVIEADTLADSLIWRMGYKIGANFGERLETINPGQIENIEDLKKAHQLRNRIVLDASFILSRDEAEEALATWEEFLRYHEVFD